MLRNSGKPSFSEDLEISAIEAARKLGVGLDYVYSLLWTGKLSGHKVGKRWSITAAAVDERLRRLSEHPRRTGGDAR